VALSNDNVLLLPFTQHFHCSAVLAATAKQSPATSHLGC